MNQKKKLSGATLAADIINYLSFPVIIILIWYLVTASGNISGLLLPAPEKVINNFLSQITSGQLLTDILSSLSCVFKRYIAGALLGLLFGILMGFSARINKFFAVIFDGIRQIPGLAWFPLIILWFGIGDMAKIVLVARGTFFPVLVNTIDGVRNTNPAYTDLVKLYKVKKVDVITKLYIPSALPFVFVGLRLGAGMAWMSVVAAEMMGSTSGLGFRIITSQQLMQSDLMLVDIIVIGILGWILDYALKKLTNLTDKWKVAG